MSASHFKKAPLVILFSCLITCFISSAKSPEGRGCDYSHFSNIPKNRSIEPIELQQLSALVEGGKLNEYEFDLLYYRDGLSFQDSIEAASSAKEGWSRLSRYRSRRFQGYTHENALHDSGTGGYHLANISGASRKESREAALLSHVGLYGKLRKMGYSHNESKDAQSLKDPKNYLWLRKKGFSHDEAMQEEARTNKRIYALIRDFTKEIDSDEAIRVINHPHLTSYLTLRKFGLSVGETNQVLNSITSPKKNLGPYLQFREAGLSHSQTIELLPLIHPEDYLRAAEYAPYNQILLAIKSEGLDFDNYVTLLKSGVERIRAIQVAKTSKQPAIEVFKKLGARTTENDIRIMNTLWGSTERDYIKLRLAGINEALSESIARDHIAEEYLYIKSNTRATHEEILDASKRDHESYVKARNAGASHLEALETAELSKFVDDYAKIRSAKQKDGKTPLNITHHEALIASNQINPDEYIQIRQSELPDGSLVPHFEALDAVSNYDVDEYIYLRERGIGHRHTIEVIDEFYPKDYYAIYVLCKNHQQTLDVLQSYESEDYVKVFNSGATHNETMEVLELDLAEGYAVKREQGKSHRQALDELEDE